MKKSRMRPGFWRTCIFAGTVLLLVGGGVSGADLVVSPGESIGAKVQNLRPGDTLLVKKGVYSESITISGLKGTQAAPIVIKGEPGAEINVSGGEDGILIYGGGGSAWVTIDGLKIMNARRAGVIMSRSQHITVRNCICLNNRKWGIQTVGCDYITVENCDLSGSTIQHGVYFSSTDHPVARNNRIYNNAACGIHMNGEKKEGGDGLIMGGIIENNVIYGNGFKNGGSAINMSAAEKTIVRNNLLYNNGAGGIVSYAGDIGHAGSSNQIYNNTVYFRPGEGRFGLQLVNGTKDTTVKNNIFVGGRGPALAVDRDSLDGLRSDYNIYYQHGGKDPIELPRDNRMSLEAWRRATSQDVHSLSVDPRFENASSGDFHLKADSRGINGGTAAPVDRDLEGKKRPVGRAIDIGAYEK